MLPIDDPQLLELFGQSTFWARYYWNDGWINDPLWDSGEDEGEAHGAPVSPVSNSPIVLGLGGAYDLLLGLEWPDLSIKTPAQPEPMRIAWDDSSHFMPNVLRWDELRTICACLSRRHRKMPSAIPTLLLCRFTPVTPDDNHQGVRQFLKESWESLGLFSPAHIESLVNCTAYFVEEFRWTPDAAQGWVLDDERAYSLRRSENPDFPFAELNRLFEMARLCAGCGA